tara:strand:- start:2742 stop:4682 length:1941 start_codon:yes stop_codon:yes gene_type:complete
MEKLNLTIFAGGSGNQDLLKILSQLPWINVNVITNCYDDGKSTGRIRSLIKELLGPSDIRKNVTSLLNLSNKENIKLKNILECRLENSSFRKLYNNLKADKGQISNLLNVLDRKKYKSIFYYINLFLTKFKNLNKLEKDLSLGNLIIAGIFLEERNFNRSVKIFNQIFLNKNIVYNVTTGTNLFLIALRQNGEIVYEEGDLVETSGSKISDIFLVKKKFNNSQKKKINKFNFLKKLHYLKKVNNYPNLNKDLLPIIKNSDIIVYGPGTQYSSLFPSYLTKELSNKIKKSKAKKIFIGNIFYDFDIVDEKIENLIKKFFYYMYQKKKLDIKKNHNLIDYYFINDFDESDVNNMKKNNYINFISNKNINKYKFLDWEKSNGKHYPGLLLKELINVSGKKKYLKQLSQKFYTVSIIIPCLNEEKTILNTLQNIYKLPLQDLNLTKEIIVVDGGSNDNSKKIIKKFKYCKFFESRGGKGDALKLGISKAKGELIAFYPSDNEYSVNDLKKIIKLIVSNQESVIYGNRNIKMANMSSKIKKIYNNKFFSYLISKYGGMILSILCLLCFNRYVSDSLTSIKVFKSKIIKDLKLYSNGFDIDLEITSKLLKKEVLILEVPVQYQPRFKNQGKKITLADGINCIVAILKTAFFK